MWLVLGGGGQLGRSMDVVLREIGIPAEIADSARCDITDPASLSRVMSEVSPDVVVNCAAWTAVDAAEDHEARAFLVNCQGTRNVAVACRERSAQLVHVSTDYVFPGTKVGEYLESDPTGPQSVYGHSKLCGETAVLEENPGDSRIVRTAWLYSAFGSNFVKTMLRRALSGQPARVVNDQFGQPTLAMDLAHHIVDLVNANAPTGVYHGTNSGRASWFELAQQVFLLATGSSDLVTPVGSNEYPTKATRPANSVLSHSRTREARVTEMRDWQLALADSIGQIINSVRLETA